MRFNLAVAIYSFRENTWHRNVPQYQTPSAKRSDHGIKFQLAPGQLGQVSPVLARTEQGWVPALVRASSKRKIGILLDIAYMFSKSVVALPVRTRGYGCKCPSSNPVWVTFFFRVIFNNIGLRIAHNFKKGPYIYIFIKISLD